MAQRIRSLLPRGLYGRAALILVLPIVTIQLLVSVAFIQRHFEGVTEQMTAGVVLEIGAILAAAEGAEDPLPAAAAAAAPLRLVVTPGDPEIRGDRREAWDFSGRTVIEVLRAGMPGIRAVDLASNRREVRVQIDAPFGPVEVVAERRRVSASNPHQLLVLMVLAGVLLTVIAYVFLRAQLRPIAKLAEAAEAFGRGRTVAYKPRGATEVRAAGAAFLDMRARIERQIEQRTLLLSGVSHDLRTPLTRMKLSLAMIDDGPEAQALRSDVAEMERMLDAFLAFARGDAVEAPQNVDLRLLVEAAVDRARRGGQAVDLVPPPAARWDMPLRPDAVGRALDNLLGNAARHGNRVRVTLVPGERSATVSVEDDGPGIPKDRRDEALRPFTRLDPARDPNRGGGVGLGLAIVADIARSHGGSLRLADSADLGGLRADLVLMR
ncbi:MAG: ATP-binding protein [Gemmobacter sp.]